MKAYRLKPKPMHRGLTKSSFVKEPAIESNFMYFNSEEVLKFVDEEKREIYAPLLIPNKLIFRKNINGESANVYFTAEDIKELHLQGMKNGYDSKINLEHSDMNADGVFCFESWIVEDPNNDKSNALGFDLPKGTLMKAYKIESEEILNEIKNKDLNGLSIEVVTDDLEFIEENNNNNKTKMNKNKKSIIGYIKSLFNTELAKDYGNGYFGESLEEGSIITDKEGNPAVDSEFTFEGKKYETDSMGTIIGIIEDVKVEMEGEVKKTEDIDALKSKITELEIENAELKAEISKAKNEAVKMKSEIIESKKIAPIVKEKSYESMTNFEKLKFNRGLI